jgi:hypothetical protein
MNGYGYIMLDKEYKKIKMNQIIQFIYN